MNLQKFPSEGLSAGEPSLCHTGISLYCLCHCVLHIDDGSTIRNICQVRAVRRNGIHVLTVTVYALRKQ